jgi:hypothetical protein
MGEKIKPNNISKGTVEGKRSLRRQRHRWVDKLKTYLRLEFVVSTSGSIKCSAVLKRLHNKRLQKMFSSARG